jgi:hypothetical protein
MDVETVVPTLAARNLRRAGIPESMIKLIGGWKTTIVFHRYAIVNRQDRASAIRQYEEHQRNLPKPVSL